MADEINAIAEALKEAEAAKAAEAGTPEMIKASDAGASDAKVTNVAPGHRVGRASASGSENRGS